MLFFLVVLWFISHFFSKWTNLRCYTLTIGKLDRRLTSMRIQRKTRRFPRFCLLPKIILITCIAVFLCLKNGKNTGDCLLAGVNLGNEVNIGRNDFCLFALTKIKRTSHKYFFFFMILMVGDVNPNPGPVRHPCSSCLKPVAKNHRAILCDNCDLWAHTKCEKISPKLYEK